MIDPMQLRPEETWYIMGAIHSYVPEERCPTCGHLQTLHNHHCCAFCLIPGCQCKCGFFEEDHRCETCQQLPKNVGPVTKRYPYLEDREEAKKLAYWSCDPCFKSVWAGEL